MNRSSDSVHPSGRTTCAPSPSRSPVRDRRKRAVIGGIMQGSVFGFAAFLLGSCELLFSSAPLGIGLLCGSSVCTWYIFGGLVLGAFLHPVGLTGWAWVGVYLLCLALRLTVRFFVDPPSMPDGKPCRGRVYMRLCLESFRRNMGFARSPAFGDTTTDYYRGTGRDTVCRAPEREGASDGDSVPTDGLGPDGHLFAEHPLLRMMTAAVGGFAAGLIGLISGHFHVYDLLSLVVSVLLAPLASVLLIACFGDAGLTLLFSPKPLRGNESTVAASRILSRFHAFPLISVSCLWFFSVYAARTFSLPLGTRYLTVEWSVLLGLLLTLSALVRLGFVAGCLVSVLCGTAASPVMIPAFLLCAAAYAVFRVFSRRIGVMCGCCAAGLWCVSGVGEVFLIRYIPSVILAIPVYLVTERIFRAAFAAPSDEEEDASADFAAAVSAQAQAERQRSRLLSMSEAFSALSSRFYRLSDQLKRPKMPELKRLCDEAFATRCATCRDRDLCWGTAYDRTLETETRLAGQLRTRGKADAAALPETLQEFCPYLDAIVADINTRCAHLTETLLKREKTEVFASDYEAMAAWLHEALEEDGEEGRCNREAADRIFEYLMSEGVHVEGVVVCGKRNCRVIVRGTNFGWPDGEGRASGGFRSKGRPEAWDEWLTRIRERLEALCGVGLSEPEFEFEDTYAVMTLHSEPPMNTEYAGSTLPCGTKVTDIPPDALTDTGGKRDYFPPDICGDHIALFRTDNAYFYALISDGMGTGEEASLTSDICTTFMEKMLSAGNHVEISLRMLNSLIRSKNSGTGEECSATVDLMELDLFNGHAVFAKNGAAPTYVVRDGTVYKLFSRTMPIGILKESDPQFLRFRMHPGDVVVMVSDGVTSGNDECPWLIDLLSDTIPDSMDSLRADIIRRALSSGSPDDLSAIAIRVVGSDTVLPDRQAETASGSRP